MKRKKLWITLVFANLCIVPLLGMLLRTEFLFNIPFLEYKNILSAHSHFAFGGWITLALMILFVDCLLLPETASKNKYQIALWGIQLTSAGMVITFPFTGYGLMAIIFSTLFIFSTYYFSVIFINDLLKTNNEKSVILLAFSALICLIVSSAGPFTLAYLLATKTGNYIIYHDALYSYLHFQYNGFFTLGVFALFINHILKSIDAQARKTIYRFSFWLVVSIVPSLFLSLTWHRNNELIYIFAIVGTGLIFMTLIYFLSFVWRLKKKDLFTSRTAYRLWVFAMISFATKLMLQMCTIIPQLSTMVFGYRPIIIGFLHLVFLGLVTFYLLAHFIEIGAFNFQKGITKKAMIVFSAGIILNETILMIQGGGLMLLKSSHLYGWLLWLVSMLLLAGAVMIFTARVKSLKN